MDIGVVTIKYLEKPGPPVELFFADLQIEALEGFDDPEDEDDWVWGGGWGRDGIAEFSQSYLEKKATVWVEENAIDVDGRVALFTWLSALPWEDEMIMLHLGS